MVICGDLLNYKRPKRSEMVPMEIVAYMQSGVVGDYLFPIDSILYYGWHRLILGPRFGSSTRSLSDHQYDGGVMPLLPLARVNEETPDWYYAASCAVWENFVEGESFWVKRFPVKSGVDWLGKVKKVPVSGGLYRSYYMPVYYRFSPVIKWYAVGVPGLVRLILNCVSAIGKKTEMGWGFVLRWEVREVDFDWSVRNDGGVLMRPIPSWEGGVLYGIRPPYWLPENQRLCELPLRASVVGV